MEDLRIRKTKSALKHTLIELLDETPFEKLTVSDLCRRAYTSRVTYYTYYDDKYSLIDDMLDGYHEEAAGYYRALVESRSEDSSPYTGYTCLLMAILKLYDNNPGFFRHVSASKNPYLYSSFYRLVFDSVVRYIDEHREYLTARYPARETAALLCGGLWAVINESYICSRSKTETRQYILCMYNSLLKSRLFYLTDLGPNPPASIEISQDIPNGDEVQ